MYDKICPAPRLSAPSLRTIALCVCVCLCVCVMMMMMMASSESVATVVTLLNHAASHLKILIPMELLNTLMILFLLTEVLGT
jgi:hypothetical protein